MEGIRSDEIIHSQRRGTSSFAFVTIGFLSFLVNVVSVSIGGKLPSYLDHLDNRKLTLCGCFSDREGESHRELENDGNETGEQMVPAIDGTKNATINTTATADNEVMVHVSRAILGVTISLGATAVMLSILSWVFVYVHRKNSLVTIGQPPCKCLWLESEVYAYFQMLWIIFVDRSLYTFPHSHTSNFIPPSPLSYLFRIRTFVIGFIFFVPLPKQY